MKKICFTGHRNIKNPDNIRKNLTALLEKLIINGATDFYAGGALGFDMLCEFTVIELRKKYPHIKLHMILPCSNEEQTADWNDDEKLNFNIILNSADSIEYTSEHYSKNCMKIRNSKLVEYSECCICYYSGKTVSGTAQTLRMAERKKITVYNIMKIINVNYTEIE